MERFNYLAGNRIATRRDRSAPASKRSVRSRSLRAAAIGDLVVLPFLVGGLAAVLLSMGQKTASGSAFHAIYGAKLTVFALLSFLAVPWFYFRALVYRRQVQLHARYLMATALMLLGTIMNRLVDYLPFLHTEGPEGFTWDVRVANVISLVIALLLYRSNPRHGDAYRLSAIVISKQIILWEVAGKPAQTGSVFLMLSQLPLLPVFSIFVALGALVSWAGWTLGKRTRVLQGTSLI